MGNGEEEKRATLRTYGKIVSSFMTRVDGSSVNLFHIRNV